ncbi:MAG TPA: hypothetical protein VKU41_09215, partial [Polyangiaceae bacterium]|nr:hypothetical protein [Polyangiaceae bacterium]
LVGATAGDVLPNQVGVVDGAYRAFAGALGLSAAPARALSIALVARTAQLVVAGTCAAVVAVTRRAAPARDEATTTSIRAGARS